MVVIAYPISMGFHGELLVLNIIKIADITRREKYGISWDVRRVSSA
jgi:hypothetical protein